MANPWFRMYSEFAHDHKLQMMSEANQRRFIMLLCLRCSNGIVTLHDTQVAFQLRISEEEWNTTKALFVAQGIIDSDNNVLNWEKRQFISDSSRERVARYRERHGNGKSNMSNVTVTVQDTDTDTDTEQNKKTIRAPRFDAVQHLVSLGVVEQVARDYCQQRKKKATATAIDGIYKQAQKAGISLNKALEICCARGWEGFKAEWIKDKPQQGQQLTAYQQSIKSAGISIFGNLEEKYAERTIDATPITRQLGTKDF
jgi:hypothetical protein